MGKINAEQILIWAAFTTIAIVQVIGLFLPLMDIDASQYALISKEMFTSGNFLEVFCRGKDYLDKPPFVFWSACVSFFVFGIHDWAYRLPSFLASILGTYSLYKFTSLYYSKRTGIFASLILASCQAIFLMQHDVRTDTMLTASGMFTVWQLSDYLRTNKWRSLLLASVGIAISMLTKGPIGLLIPVLAFSTEFIIKKQYSSFFKWQWLVLACCVAILLIPMSIGLYTQYDLHRDKQVYGIDGPSGLRFYYWTQSFGRLTGESTWDNNPEPFFLMQSFAWSFLPWILLFIPAFYTLIRHILRKNQVPEYITLGGFVLPFLFLSLSKYQLPHYIFPLVPFACVQLAYRLTTQLENTKNISILKYALLFTGIIEIGIASWLVFFAFPDQSVLLYGIGLVGFLAFLYFTVSRKTVLSAILFPGVLLACSVNLFLNGAVYPSLFLYQSDSQAAFYLQKHSTSSEKIAVYKTDAFYSFDFYSPNVVDFIATPRSLAKKSWVYTNESGLKDIQVIFPKATVIPYKDFHVSTLTADFLNPATRLAQCEIRYLVRL